MNFRGLESRLKMLEPSLLIDDDGLVEAVERVLNSMPPEEVAAFEAAIEEQLALADAGFSEAEIEGMLQPETLEILEDLEARAAALLPEVRKQQAALYRLRYHPMIEVRDAD